ncbi:hypothetical protein F959_02219, partial [Acinetobacter venetianus RAG-1 = CIP 110063]
MSDAFLNHLNDDKLITQQAGTVPAFLNHLNDDKLS